MRIGLYARGSLPCSSALEVSHVSKVSHVEDMPALEAISYTRSMVTYNVLLMHIKYILLYMHYAGIVDVDPEC